MSRDNPIDVRLNGKYKDGISSGVKASVSAMKTVTVALAAITAAAAATGGALFYMTSNVAAAGDNIDKMSKRVGASVEFLSAMGYAAELGGASLRDVEMAMRGLARNAEGANQGLETSARAFRTLGVDIRDAKGELKNAETLFWDVQKGLSALENEMQKSAIAQQLMGRSGTTLVPMLNQTTEAIQDQMDTADRLGTTLTKAQATMAADFVDAQTKMKHAVGGLKRELSEELMPVLTESMDELAEFLAANRDLFEGTGEVLASLIESGKEFVQSFDYEELFDRAETQLINWETTLTMDLIPALKEWEDESQAIIRIIERTDRVLSALGGTLNWLIGIWDSYWRGVNRGVEPGMLMPDGGEYPGVDYSPIRTPNIDTPIIPTPQVGGLSLPNANPTIPAFAAVSGSGAPMIVEIAPVVNINGIPSQGVVREIMRALGPAIAKDIDSGRIPLKKYQRRRGL